MKIFEINSGNYSSTGNIMLNIAKTARENGHEVKVAYRKSRSVTEGNSKDEILIGNSFFGLVHRVFSEIFGLEGCFSVIPTLKLIKEIKKFNPDIIHLHILHGWYINLPILFKFLKKSNVPVIWTMHDCWAFTGHCPHFQIAKCDKWQNGCYNCPQYRDYPYSRVDNAKFMYKLKKKHFLGLKNLTIVTPSIWLANLVKQSFLKEYNVKVINNGIDLSIFKPQESRFKEANNIQDKKMLLGVAFDWGYRKGLDIFNKLADDLSDDYKIVLVGTTKEIENDLNKKILTVKRTKTAGELVDIYSSADLFLNPTREEVLGLVNIEALACGTSVLTFETGGSPECIDDTCGSSVSCDDYEGFKNKIIDITENKPFTKVACVNYSKNFDMNKKFKEYVDLYENI